MSHGARVEGVLPGWRENVIAPEKAEEATERVQRFLDRLKRASGNDKEIIHAFDAGADCEVYLLASDLRAILVDRQKWISATPTTGRRE